MKLFNKAQELKYVSLTYKNYEIHILFEIQGRNKIDYFKEDSIFCCFDIQLFYV